jgi:hypothetical protein
MKPTRLTGARLSVALLLLAPLVGCSSNVGSGDPAGSTTSDITSTSSLCNQLAHNPGRVGVDTYPTDAGRIRLGDGRIELDAPTGTRTLAQEARRLVDVREIDAVTHIFYTIGDSEETELMVVTTENEPVYVAVGDAPEYSVTAVAKDPTSGHWVLTALADLTEVIVIVDSSGEVLDTFAPYEYNRGPFLALVEPVAEGGYVALEAPEGDVSTWSVATLDAKGQLRVRLPIPDKYGTPTGWYDRARSGQFAIGTAQTTILVTIDGANMTFAECASKPYDRIIRQ